MDSPSSVRGTDASTSSTIRTPGRPPLGDDLAVPVDGEPVAHRGRDGRPDALDAGDRGQRRGQRLGLGPGGGPGRLLRGRRSRLRRRRAPASAGGAPSGARRRRPASAAVGRLRGGSSPGRSAEPSEVMAIPAAAVARAASAAAASIASIEPNSRASACAAVGPDVPDRQPDQHPPQRPVLGRLQVGQQLAAVGRQLALLRAEQLDAQQVVLGEREDVALVLHHAGAEQRDGGLVAQPLDVERAPAGHVEQPLPQLRGAGAGVRAAQVDVAGLLLGQLGAALRAVRGHHELALGAVAQLDDRARAPRG